MIIINMLSGKHSSAPNFFLFIDEITTSPRISSKTTVEDFLDGWQENSEREYWRDQTGSGNVRRKRLPRDWPVSAARFHLLP